MGFGRGEMREIELEGERAGLFRDNDEKIDPDKDFPHIDKRIQNALGHYQKDFMGEISAEILGPKYGGYGSFLPVDWNSPVPTLTRPQMHFSSRSPHNRTTEVRQNSAIHVSESGPSRSRPGFPPLARLEASASDCAADVGCSGEAFQRKQSKTFPADHSDNNMRNVRTKMGTENAIDNSAIYSGLGLDISPSSSSLGDSPLDLDGTSPCVQGLPEESPSHIIKVMTSIPIPDGELLSPLSENLLSLMEEKEVSLGANSRTPMKAERESITSEGIMSIVSEKGVKQMNKNKVSVSEVENYEDSAFTTGHCSKRMEDSKASKGKEPVLENSVSAIDGLSDRKDSSTITRKDKFASIPIAPNERIKVEEGVDVVPKTQKPSHVSQVKSTEKMDFTASPVVSSNEKGNPIKSIQKIQRDNNVKSVTRGGVDRGELRQTGYLEQNCIKSEEQMVKKKVKRELHESFSPQSAGVLHQPDRITEEDADKFTKRERIMNKVKALPDSAYVEAGTCHEKTDMEMIHNGRKDSFVVVKDVGSKQKNRTEDCFQGMRDLDEAMVESQSGGSSKKNLPLSRVGANLHKKDPLSSEGKKKTRVNLDGSQSTAVPKVSFKVSSAASGIQTNRGGNVMSQGETQPKMRKVKDKVSSVAGKAGIKKKEKVEAVKGSIVGLAEREKHALSIKVEDSTDVTGFQYPSEAGSIPREDVMNSSHMMEKAPTSAMLPTEIAPAVIQENWVQCDKCQTWRLLPHNINPDDLPKRWLCNMLDWLPGMNDCRFTEAETQAALLALYQPLPPVIDSKIHETYPNVGPSVVAPDTQTNPAAGLDAPLGSGKRPISQENRAKHKQDQLYSVESVDKQKLSQSRSGAGKPVVIGMKRGGSKDTLHPVPKKMKRDSQQFAKDLDPVAPFSVETANDGGGVGNSNTFEKLRDNSQKPAGTTEDDRSDLSARKRKLKDRHKGTVGAQTPSQQVLSKESNIDTREEKRQRSRLPGKESSTTRTDDKNEVGNQHNPSHSGGGLPKVGRKEGKRSEQHHAKNMSQNSVDGKLSRLDPEQKMPALVAATSSSSKVSSTNRFKLKPQAKASPVGSISSSPLKVSRSNHDRSEGQISTRTEQELSSGKKNREARIVAPGFAPDHAEKTKGKSRKEADLQSQFCPAQEETVKKTSAVKHIDGDRRATLPKSEAFESKQLGVKVKGEESTSHRVFPSDDQQARCLSFKSLDKPKLDNVVPERVKSKQDQAGSSGRHNTSSRTQEMGFEEGRGCNSMAAHDGKGKLPKQLGRGESVAYDAGASSSVGKDNYDWATTIKEAKDLKHSAARMEDIRLGLRMSFEAALKFLHGASLLESGSAEGSRSGDLKPCDVYSSTATLCHYCAREFEKFDDMACAALAYKCMEVAYMRVVYAHNVEAIKDRHALQQSMQRAIPQVESPSSSASDVDNVNNPTSNDAVRASQSLAVRGNHVIPAGIRHRYVRVLDFVQNVNVAMNAATKSQSAFAAARITLGEAGSAEAISSVKRALDFSFHDMDELLHLVRLAMEFFTVD